jgi:putative membrane protein
MWAPGSIAYLAAAVWIGWRWLRAPRGLRVEAA